MQKNSGDVLLSFYNKNMAKQILSTAVCKGQMYDSGTLSQQRDFLLYKVWYFQ